MRVLIADKFEKVGIDGLKELGCEVESQPDLGADTLPGALERGRPADPDRAGQEGDGGGAQGGGEPEPGDPGRRRDRHHRRGGGVEPRRVRLQLPGQELDRGGGTGDGPAARPATGGSRTRWPSSVRGRWNKGEYSKARGLHGRTLGIVGLGQIGREIATRAQAFGMRVVAWSPEPDARRRRRGWASPTPRRRSRWRAGRDAVTINVAANAETKHLVNAEFLARHAAGRVPHQHLARVGGGRGGAGRGRASTKGIRAGLDVYEDEPGGAKAEFAPAMAQLPGVYGTHHVGASTDQAQVAIAHEVIRIVQQFQRRGDGAQLRQPAGAELGDARALGAAPEPARRAGPRVQGAGRRRPSTSRKWRTSSTTAPQATLARIHLIGAPDAGAAAGDPQRQLAHHQRST